MAKYISKHNKNQNIFWVIYLSSYKADIFQFEYLKY